MNSIKLWIQKSKSARINELYERGFGYACCQMLLRNKSPLEMMAEYESIDKNQFDIGMCDAVNILIISTGMKDNRI